MVKKSKIIRCIIGIAVLGILGSVVFFFIEIPQNIIGVVSAWVGIAGTAASIILSIMAMIYSNKSSKDAESSLEKITEQYKILCKELASQEIKKSLGKSGVQSIIQKNQKIIDEDNQEV